MADFVIFKIIKIDILFILDQIKFLWGNAGNRALPSKNDPRKL